MSGLRSLGAGSSARLDSMAALILMWFVGRSSDGCARTTTRIDSVATDGRDHFCGRASNGLTLADAKPVVTPLVFLMRVMECLGD